LPSWDPHAKSISLTHAARRTPHPAPRTAITKPSVQFQYRVVEFLHTWLLFVAMAFARLIETILP
jgi:hypothetical protein